MKKILTMLMALPVLFCEATTYYVSPSGNDSANGTTPETAFLTPKTATGKAKSGDTILLCKGTYKIEAAIAVPSGVTLRGETDNPRDTVIDAQGKCTAIVIQAGNTGNVVSSLTVSNGYTSVQYRGSGIQMANSTTISESGSINLITNCVVTCCNHGHSSDQASLQINAMGRVVDSVISYCTNTSWTSSGAVALYDGGELINSVIENNEGGTCGGGVVGIVKSNNATSMLVKGCTIRKNTAKTAGAGVANVITVQDCIIEGNKALKGAGIYYTTTFRSSFLDSAFVTVSNTVVRANSVTDESSYGGGLAWAEYASVTNFVVDSCVFSNNTSAASGNATECLGGGAIYMRPNKIGGLAVLRNSLFVANEQLETIVNRGGAAIWLDGGKTASEVGGVIRVENCTFAANRNYSASNTSLYLGDKQIVFVTNTVVAANLDKDGVACASIEGGSGNWKSNFSYSYIYPAYNGTFDDKTVINGTSEPKFEEGTWIPSIHSPFRDAGLTLDWMNGSYDLQRDEKGKAFRKRVLGKSVDMGCFEYLPPGLTVLVK